MPLRNHIADYQRALSNNNKYFIRCALEQLHYDSLVQVMIFMQGDALANVLHTLSAVCPQARLDAETLAWTSGNEKDCVKVSVWNERLFCHIQATAATAETPKVALTLWWAGRCGLPLHVDVHNARSDVLTFLTNGPKSLVEKLEVKQTSEPACMRGNAATCDGSCSTFLCTLSAFTNLRELSIQWGGDADGGRASAAAAKVLRTVAQLPIAKVQLRGFEKLKSCSALSGAQHLRSLTVAACGIQSVVELLGCPNLTMLDVSDNPLLKSVAGLAGAPCLEELSVQGCDLDDLEGLASCLRLRKLDASSNSRLETTRSLAGAPSLEELHVCCCDALLNVEGLSSCPLLKILDVQFSFELEDFRGAAGAPSLSSINANGCGLASLAGLGSCPQLTDIDFSENDRFPDPSDLAGAPSLRFVNACDTGLRNLSGLNRCPQLTEILLSASERLEDISGLAGAPRLEKVNAMNCNISNVNGLGSCPLLAELDLGNNRPLEDITDLARCPNLKILDVCGTGVTDVSMFSPSVAVRM